MGPLFDPRVGANSIRGLWLGPRPRYCGNNKGSKCCKCEERPLTQSGLMQRNKNPVLAGFCLYGHTHKTFRVNLDTEKNIMQIIFLVRVIYLFCTDK